MPPYVMWPELGHCHFLYMPAVLNVITTRNGMGTKNVLKWNSALGFEFSIQSSVYGYCKFLLYVNVEIDPFSCEQKLAI